MAEIFSVLDEHQSRDVIGREALKLARWLQGITFAWMAIEAGISLYAAVAASSIALLAFASDSLVELLSAVVVLLSLGGRVFISRDRAARWAGILLFVLAGVVAITAVRALLMGDKADVSPAGIAITITALMVMPILAWFKRRLGRKTNNRALMADAVQSATCAYLAAITLVGLVMNAAFHISWIDSVAALAVLPLLVVEGRRALHGDSCSCC